MEQLLQKLLEADVLSADTKKELETAFKDQINEAVQTAKEEAARDVRTELTEQWVRERDVLIEAIDNKLEEQLKTELTELKSDIESFRDLEAEYAQKLVEAKAAMANELKKDMIELVEKLDTFLEMRLSEEMQELREDIEVVRENEFGRRIFEAVREEYQSNFSDSESDAITSAELKSRLADAESALEESQNKVAAMERDAKMSEVLSPLTGRIREVMEAILRNVDTSRLEEGYKTFIGRVIRESKEEDVTEKEGKVLAGNSSGTDDNQLTEGKTEGIRGVVITGDDETRVITEGQDNKSGDDRLNHLRKLAGMV